jgi:hypothetical protein
MRDSKVQQAAKYSQRRRPGCSGTKMKTKPEDGLRGGTKFGLSGIAWATPRYKRGNEDRPKIAGHTEEPTAPDL